MVFYVKIDNFLSDNEFSFKAKPLNEIFFRTLPPINKNINVKFPETSFFIVSKIHNFIIT